VVIVIEDTETFDDRVLADLLLALSDAGDVLPVCVILGVATSAAMVHGKVPGAVAARLQIESFHLWSPKANMAAVQEQVLLHPAMAPALSNTALELVMRRFKEHDYSLSGARRTMHLLALDHFMTQPLSALTPAAVAVAVAAGAGAEAVRGGYSYGGRGASGTAGGCSGGGGGRLGDESEVGGGGDDGVDADVHMDDVSGGSVGGDESEEIVARCRAEASEAAAAAKAVARKAVDDILSPKALKWAHNHLGQQHDNLWVSRIPEVARGEIADAVAAVYPTRRRWELSLRCIAAAAEVVSPSLEKGNLANLLVDASRVKWMGDRGGDRSDLGRGSGGEGVRFSGGSQGDSLLRLLCSRLESQRERLPLERLSALLRQWLSLVARDAEMFAAEGAHLAESIRLCSEQSDATNTAVEAGTSEAGANADTDANANANVNQNADVGVGVGADASAGVGAAAEAAAEAAKAADAETDPVAAASAAAAAERRDKSGGGDGGGTANFTVTPTPAAAPSPALALASPLSGSGGGGGGASEKRRSSDGGGSGIDPGEASAAAVEVDATDLAAGADTNANTAAATTAAGIGGDEDGVEGDGWGSGRGASGSGNSGIGGGGDDNVVLSPVDNAAAVKAALIARRRMGPQQARQLELAAAARGKNQRSNAGNSNARASSPTRDPEGDGASERQCGRDKGPTNTAAAAAAAAAAAVAAAAVAAAAAAVAAAAAAAAAVAAEICPHARAAAFLCRVARAHASRPPASLDGQEIFCVTSTACLRQAVEAAPRLTLEQSMAGIRVQVLRFLRLGRRV
jgi:origin recognition complex subunit 3